MGLFPETIARQLAGGKVECANLVLFDFASRPMRLWLGGGTLETNDGNQWSGVSKLGDMKGIEQAVNGEAPQATFTLSGVDDEIIRVARDEFRTEAKGRLARVYFQFFGVDDPADPDNQRPLDNPYPCWAGRMLQPSFAMDDGGDGEAATGTITVTAESIFSLRSRPRWSMLTDRDQAGRYPGVVDKGFQFVADVVNKVVTWPDF